MKRNYIVCALILALALISGCAQQQNQLSNIGAEEAQQQALAASGLAAGDVESITAKLDTRDGLDYYRVDFTAAGQSYQYDIDALTGVVIDSAAPPAPAETGSATAAASTVQPDQAEPAAQQPDTGTGTDTALITEAEAQAAALNHAGLTQDQVTFLKSKLEYENGRQIYDVEFYTQDKREYDYEIDAGTGEIIAYDYDAEGYSESGSAITADQAKELALSQVPGATLDDIREFETDYDDGRMEYEGKIIYDGMEYEFGIDGYSGAIRSWEAEPTHQH